MIQGDPTAAVPAEAVTLIRPITQDDVRCPAGEAVREDSCRCAIERGVIDGRKNPHSIEAFCLGEFTACPTWRREKERLWAHERTELVDRRPSDYGRVRGLVDARKARHERARELMESNSEEGRRFRARVHGLVDPDRNPFVRKDSTAAERARAARRLAAGVPLG